MKLLSIVSAAYKGGATFSFLSTIKGLQLAEVDLLVILPQDGFLCEELDKLGIPYIITPIAFSVWPPLNSYIDLIKFIPRIIWYNLINHRSYKKLNRVVNSWKPDIIHTNVSVIDLGYKLAKNNGIPHLWHIREYGDKDFNFHFFPSKSKFIKKLKDSYSIAITNDLKSHYSLDSKCRVIYNPIEFPPKEIENINRTNTILYVGRLTKNKGVTDLVKAFVKTLSKTNKYKLELIGEGENGYINEIKRYIAENNVADQIELKGYCNNIYELMRSSRAIIVSSKCEGFGRITAEAMINECIVIGRNTGGTKEQFDNGLKLCGSEIGFRFNSFEELPYIIGAMSSLSNMELQSIIDNAKSTVKLLYNVQSNVSNTIKFINEIQS